MDTLKRYKGLTRAERITEISTMLDDVFRRLEEHGGTPIDDLCTVSEGLTERLERRRSELRRSKASELETT